MKYSLWYGSNIWDLFSPQSVRVESSYNRSVKVAMGLPLNTHRCLIQQLSGRPHLRITLCKRFLRHIEAIRESNKVILRTLLKVTEQNAQSTTGRNLRNIALQLNKWPISDLRPYDAVNIPYFPPGEDDIWMLDALRESLLPGEDIPLLSPDELEYLECLCTG